MKGERDAYCPEIQHKQYHHDDVVGDKAAAEKAADDVYNNSCYLHGPLTNLL